MVRNHYKDLFISDEESEDRSFMDAWVYQTCTEFGYFQTSEKKDALLGNRIPLDLYVDQCAEFGPRFYFFCRK